jgi:hypothetical protein
MTDLNRRTSEVDVVAYEPSGATKLVAELKAWDIGHQLFDLAKVCCLLAGGVPAGFLICVAKREGDFDRLPGGELVPADEGDVREHPFAELIARHVRRVARHVGKGLPEPTSVPSVVSTTSVSSRRRARGISRPLHPSGRGRRPRPQACPACRRVAAGLGRSSGTGS